MKTHSTLRRARGFSLVEVLAALFVIAVGMLGIAKMQALALSSTGSAGTRSLVAIEASSLAASMHADRDYWTNPPVVTNVNVAAGTVSIDVPALANTQNCLNIAGTCGRTMMAGYDLQNWGAALAQILPAANANISCQNTSVPLSCTITITWIENMTGLSATTSQNDAASAPSSSTANILQQPQYTLYVEP